MRALRRCPRCGEAKPPAEFYARQDRPGRDRPQCRSCHKAMAAEWQRDNRARSNASKAEYRLRHLEEDRERSRRRRAKLKARFQAGA